MKTVSIRIMTARDLPAADALRLIAGWHQTPQDWRRVRRLEPRGCFVAACDQLVVGTVTTTTYGSALAWIGMMLVHPDYRGRGIGTRLMQQALQYLRRREVECVKLDATPAGRPVYEKLGFVPEWTLTRCERPANSVTAIPEGEFADTRRLSEADWRAVDAIDSAAFGLPRPRLIRSLAEHCRSALVWPDRGRVLGWGLLRPRASADYFGPAACSRPEGSLSLLHVLLRTAGVRPVIWDVPDLNEAAKMAARRCGFVALRPLTRMRLGPALVAGDPATQFAIADPSLG